MPESALKPLRSDGHLPLAPPLLLGALWGSPGDVMCKASSLPLFILLSWLNALTPLVSVGPGRPLPSLGSQEGGLILLRQTGN